jgi:ribosomal protein L11 methyltransferase
MSAYVLSLTDDDALLTRVAEALDMLQPPCDAISLFEVDEDAQIWSLSAYFEAKPDEATIRAHLAPYGFSDLAFTIEALPDEDWVTTGLKDLKPVIGGRYQLYGNHDAHRMAANINNIEMNAGQAFGTGHHGTTKGCLQALDRLLGLYQFDNVLDLGTGTGILAIAAAKTLRAPVLASDIDPISVEVSNENAKLNSVFPYVLNVQGVGFDNPYIRKAAPFDLIIANILAGPLKHLAPEMRKHCMSGGLVLLSGILAAQANSVIASYRSHGFVLQKRSLLNGWATLILQKA